MGIEIRDEKEMRLVSCLAISANKLTAVDARHRSQEVFFFFFFFRLLTQGNEHRMFKNPHLDKN